MDTEAPLDCRREHGSEALSALLGHLPSPYHVDHENDHHVHNLKVVPSLVAVAAEPNAAATTRLWPVEVLLMVLVHEKQDVLMAALW